MIKLISFNAVGVVLFLSGCVSHEERLKFYQVNCNEYGFGPNSAAFAECVMRQDQSRKDRDFMRQQRAAKQGYAMMMGEGAWAVE